MRVHLFGRILCAALLLSVAPAFATVISTYNSLASWTAASSGVQNIDFEGLAPYHSISSTIYSMTLDGVSFSGVQGAGSYGMQYVDTNLSQWTNFGTNDALWLTTMNTLPVPSFHIVLPSAVTSFSMNLMSYNPGGLSYSVTAGGSTFTVPTYTVPTPEFFGATFDTPVTTIDVTPLGVIPANGTNAMIDNFSFGTAIAGQGGSDTAAPEAGTLMMIGSGLVGLTAIIKRRAKAKQ